MVSHGIAWTCLPSFAHFRSFSCADSSRDGAARCPVLLTQVDLRVVHMACMDHAIMRTERLCVAKTSFHPYEAGPSTLESGRCRGSPRSYSGPLVRCVTLGMRSWVADFPLLGKSEYWLTFVTQGCRWVTKNHILHSPANPQSLGHLEQ